LLVIRVCKRRYPRDQAAKLSCFDFLLFALASVVAFTLHLAIYKPLQPFSLFLSNSSTFYYITALFTIYLELFPTRLLVVTPTTRPTVRTKIVLYLLFSHLHKAQQTLLAKAHLSLCTLTSLKTHSSTIYLFLRQQCRVSEPTVVMMKPQSWVVLISPFVPASVAAFTSRLAV
jgi:hypothetical protein